MRINNWMLTQQKPPTTAYNVIMEVVKLLIQKLNTEKFPTDSVKNI